MTKKSHPIWFMDKDELSKVVSSHQMISDIIRSLGFKVNQKTRVILKEKMDIDLIDYSHIPLGLEANKGRILKNRLMENPPEILTEEERRERRLKRSKRYNDIHYREQLPRRMEINKKRQIETREKILNLKKTLSCPCGENHPSCLDFHHRNSDEKEVNISEIFRKGWSWKRVEKEIEKCDILCRNCHAKYHYNEKHGELV